LGKSQSRARPVCQSHPATGGHLDKDIPMQISLNTLKPVALAILITIALLLT
jgi:hypothetical protein